MPFARKQGGGCQAPRTGLLWSMLPGPGPRLGRPTPSRRPPGWRSLLERWGVGTQAWGLQGVSRAALARSLVGTGAQHSHQGFPAAGQRRALHWGCRCAQPRVFPRQAQCGHWRRGYQLAAFPTRTAPRSAPSSAPPRGAGSQLGGFQRHLVCRVAGAQQLLMTLPLWRPMFPAWLSALRNLGNNCSR